MLTPNVVAIVWQCVRMLVACLSTQPIPQLGRSLPRTSKSGWFSNIKSAIRTRNIRYRADRRHVSHPICLLSSTVKVPPFLCYCSPFIAFAPHSDLSLSIQLVAKSHNLCLVPKTERMQMTLSFKVLKGIQVTKYLPSPSISAS